VDKSVNCLEYPSLFYFLLFYFSFYFFLLIIPFFSYLLTHPFLYLHQPQSYPFPSPPPSAPHELADTLPSRLWSRLSPRAAVEAPSHRHWAPPTGASPSAMEAAWSELQGQFGKVKGGVRRSRGKPRFSALVLVFCSREQESRAGVPGASEREPFFSTIWHRFVKMAPRSR
jgi:hypothetical protein